MLRKRVKGSSEKLGESARESAESKQREREALYGRTPDGRGMETASKLQWYSRSSYSSL